MSDPSAPRSSRSDTDVTVLSLIVVILLLLLAGGGGFMLWRWRSIEQMRQVAQMEEMMARDEAEEARLQAERAQAELDAVKRRKEDPGVEDILRAGRPKPATPALEQGIKLCGQGQVGEGLLWFVRGLEQSADDAALQRTFRTNLAAWGETPPAPRSLFESKQPVTALAFSPDGKRALAGADDGNARAWPIDGGKPGVEVPHADGEVTAVGFGAGGKQWLVANRAQVRRSDVATGQPLGDSIEPPGEVLAMILTADGKMLMLGICGQGVWLSEDGGREGVKNPIHPESPVLAAALGADAKLILTGHEDHTAQLRDAGGAVLGKPLSHDAPVRGVAVSADGRLLATAAGRSVRLWDTGTHAPIGRTLEHKADVLSLAFAPDGRGLLTGDRAGTARLWQVPAPLGGDVRRLRLWAQFLAGKELDAGGTAHPLTEPALRERRLQLQALGGPPQP